MAYLEVKATATATAKANATAINRRFALRAALLPSAERNAPVGAAFFVGLKPHAISKAKAKTKAKKAKQIPPLRCGMTRNVLVGIARGGGLRKDHRSGVAGINKD